MDRHQASATVGSYMRGSESTEGGSERNMYTNLETQCEPSHRGCLLQTSVALETSEPGEFSEAASPRADCESGRESGHQAGSLVVKLLKDNVFVAIQVKPPSH